MKEKSNVSYEYPKSGGCGIGCFAIGCIGVVVCFIGLMVAGYYTAFHSSIPLRIMEAAIEDTGEVEIEGLKGSFSSGFSAEEFRFKTTDDRWSSLNDVKFDYEQDSSWFGESELVIREMSIGSGTIYADFEPENMEINLDADFDEAFDEMQDELEEAEREMNIEFGDSFDNFEFRVATVSVSDLKFVNPETDFEIVVNKIKFSDFHFKDGNIKSIGDLEVDSTQMEVETVEAIELNEVQNAQRYEAILKKAADHRLVKDLPFSVEFGISEEFDGRIVVDVCDGQVKILDTKEEYQISYSDFDQSEWITLAGPSSRFSKLNIELKFDRDKKGPIGVSPDATIRFGLKTFSDFEISESENGFRFVTGVTDVDGHKVSLQFTTPSPYSPWRGVRLDTKDSGDWARILFDKAYDELDAGELMELEEAMPSREQSKTKQDESKTDALSTENADESDEASLETNDEEPVPGIQQ